MKTYLTVNTVVYNHELIQMRKVIDKAIAHGVSAIIASDQSVLQYCDSVGAPVHLSTQLNISNIESLKFYAKFADVAVLARELDLEQVKGNQGRIVEVFLVYGFHCRLCSVTPQLPLYL